MLTPQEQIPSFDDFVKTLPSDSVQANVWSLDRAEEVKQFFRDKFKRELPVSAFGESGTHRKMGLDHRESLDVSLHPNSAEGQALIGYLKQSGIPFLAYDRAVPGAATNPHIHIGYPSKGLTGVEEAGDIPSFDEFLATQQPTQKPTLETEDEYGLVDTTPTTKVEPSTLPPLLGQTFDPQTMEGRQVRDEYQATERRPDARLLMDIGLPPGKEDWTKVSGNELARIAMARGAAQRGVPHEFIEKWLQDNGPKLKLYDIATGEAKQPIDFIGTPYYDEERRTMRVSQEADDVLRLVDDYKASRGLATRASEWATDSTRSLGEKFLDVVGPPLSVVGKGALKGMEYAGRGVGALDVAMTMRRPHAGTLAGPNPSLPMAVWKALAGEELPDEAKNPVDEAVAKAVREQYGPRVETIARMVVGNVTSPTNAALLLVGGGEGGKIADALTRTPKEFASAKGLGIVEGLSEMRTPTLRPTKVPGEAIDTFSGRVFKNDTPTTVKVVGGKRVYSPDVEFDFRAESQPFGTRRDYPQAIAPPRQGALRAGETYDPFSGRIFKGSQPTLYRLDNGERIYGGGFSAKPETMRRPGALPRFEDIHSPEELSVMDTFALEREMKRATQRPAKGTAKNRRDALSEYAVQIQNELARRKEFIEGKGIRFESLTPSDPLYEQYMREYYETHKGTGANVPETLKPLKTQGQVKVSGVSTSALGSEGVRGLREGTPEQVTGAGESEIKARGGLAVSPEPAPVQERAPHQMSPDELDAIGLSRREANQLGAFKELGNAVREVREAQARFFRDRGIEPEAASRLSDTEKTRLQAEWEQVRDDYLNSASQSGTSAAPTIEPAHHSNIQTRRQRNTATGTRGQFKKEQGALIDRARYEEATTHNPSKYGIDESEGVPRAEEAYKTFKGEYEAEKVALAENEAQLPSTTEPVAKRRLERDIDNSKVRLASMSEQAENLFGERAAKEITGKVARETKQRPTMPNSQVEGKEGQPPRSSIREQNEEFLKRERTPLSSEDINTVRRLQEETRQLEKQLADVDTFIQAYGGEEKAYNALLKVKNHLDANPEAAEQIGGNVLRLEGLVGELQGRIGLRSELKAKQAELDSLEAQLAKAQIGKKRVTPEIKRLREQADSVRQEVRELRFTLRAGERGAISFRKKPPATPLPPMSAAQQQVLSNVGMDVQKPTLTQKLRAAVKGQSPTEFETTAFDRLTAAAQDSLRPLMKAISQGKATRGAALLPEHDPEILTRLVQGSRGKFEQILDTGPVNAKNKTVKGVGGIDWLLEPFDNTSKAALENDMRDAVTLMVSERTIEKAKAIQARADAIKAKWNPTTSVKGRAKTQAAADRLKTRISGIGGGASDEAVANQVIRDLATDPARYAKAVEGAKRYRAWADATLKYWVEKGRLSQEAYNQIKASNQYYTAMQRVMETGDLSALEKGSGGRLGSVSQPVKKFKGSTKEIDNPYTNLLKVTHDMYREADRNEALRAFRDLIAPQAGETIQQRQFLNTVGRRLSKRDKTPGATTIYVNGEPERWKFEKGIEAALKNWGEVYDPNIITKVMEMPAKITRYSVTHSPDFMVRNIIRDAVNRGVISETGSKPLDVLRKSTAKEIESFKLAGGENAGYYFSDRTSYHRELGRRMAELSKDGKTIFDTLGSVKHSWDEFAGKSEQLGRMAEYRSAYNHARTKLGYDEHNASLYAAAKARDLLDFAIGGTVVKEINRFVPFTNAAVQGLTRTLRGAAQHPKAFLAKWTAYVLTPTMLTYVWNEASGAGEEYRQLPAYQRDFFWNFKVGSNKWLRIPKPFEMGVLASGVERLIDRVGNPKALEGYAGSLARGTLPIDEGAFAGPFRSVLETTANYDFFRDKEIVPKYEEDKSLELRAGTQHASRIGQAVQKILSVDARKVDHVIQSLTGGLGRAALNVSDIGREDKNLQPAQAMNAATGLFTTSPATSSVDVRKAFDLAEELGLSESAMMKPLRQLQIAYFNSKTEAERDARAEAMRKVAERIVKALAARRPQVKAKFDAKQGAKDKQATPLPPPP